MRIFTDLAKWVEAVCFPGRLYFAPPLPRGRQISSRRPYRWPNMRAARCGRRRYANPSCVERATHFRYDPPRVSRILARMPAIQGRYNFWRRKITLRAERLRGVTPIGRYYLRAAYRCMAHDGRVAPTWIPSQRLANTCPKGIPRRKAGLRAAPGSGMARTKPMYFARPLIRDAVLGASRRRLVVRQTQILH